jgi:thymidylate kinase
LLASWFSALDEILVKRQTQEGRTVILDNWYYKFAARYRLKANFPEVLIDQVFGTLSKPDAVFFLSIDPSVAASRKNGIFLPSECGVHDQPHLASRERFVSYQSEVQNQLLCELQNVDVIFHDATDLPVGDLACSIVEQIFPPD